MHGSRSQDDEHLLTNAGLVHDLTPQSHSWSPCIASFARGSERGWKRREHGTILRTIRAPPRCAFQTAPAGIRKENTGRRKEVSVKAADAKETIGMNTDRAASKWLLLVFGIGCFGSSIAHAQELRANRDCSAFPYSPPFAPVPATYRPRYHTIAHTFLDIGKEVSVLSRLQNMPSRTP